MLSGGATAEPASGQGQACQKLVEALATDGRVALQGVTFDFNRATLRPESLPALIAARDAILVLGGSWGIEGHTDNVGSRAYNQGLSDARAEAVRDWLEAAGVPPAQLSAQGFSFDRPVADNGTDAGRALNRRVELVGAVTPDMLGFGGPAGADPCPDTLTPGTMAADTAPPPIPDWSGAGGQEWLPFSVLMATGYGGATGWGGDRIDMPQGARPEACQALCADNSECAAFSFEPAGSHFVENARCALIGDGTELDLRRDNSHYDGGMFHVSGLKPDARLLTPESEAAAAEIIADLAEIARLRDTIRITAPDTHAPEAWMDVAVDGAVPGGDYPTYLEIALPGDYAFDWMQSKASLFVNDMPDGRSGQIWVPEPGEYVLRYVIDHPTAGKHTITGQPFIVLADAPVATPATPPATPAAKPATAPATAGAASLTFPMMVAPGESIPVTYSGPLHGGDWIDIITQGEDDDMSGGWSWAYAEGPPVTLTAPAEEGDYILRYVAEDPARGRVVVAQQALVVRRPPPVTIADAAIFQRCDGATGTFCELLLPAQDVVLTLAAGYGMTEPLVYETAGGARAARPSFDLVRLSDGAAVILVNARQAQTVYCQNGLSGDEICFTPAFNDGDAMLAGVLFASLASTAMQAESEAMDGEEGAPVPAGDLQGVWFFRIDMPGTPEDQAHFVVAELMQDAGDVGLQGSFLTAPDAGPLPGLSGDLAGVIAGETLNLTMEGADGVTGLVFTGTAYGSDAYRGMVYLAHAPLTPPTGAIITRIAGPGEDWEAPPWTRGEADGLDAAMQMGAQALQGILGELSGEDRAMAEMLGGMLGAMSGAPGAASANAPLAPSAEMTALGGIAVEGLGVEDALILLAPHLEERP